MNEKVKKMTTSAMLCALAFIVTVIIRISFIPAIPFVQYDPKDIIVTIGGFIFGPVTSFVISVVESVVEMITVSDSGPIGCVMNIVSTCSFSCIAALIYKKKHTMKGAITGLVSGVLVMTCAMLLWNYLMVPIFMGQPRDVIAKMLFPYFLPHNLLKGSINAAVTLLIYKPVVTGLRKANLVPETKSTVKKNNVGMIIAAAAVLITCIVVILVIKGII